MKVLRAIFGVAGRLPGFYDSGATSWFDIAKN